MFWEKHTDDFEKASQTLETAFFRKPAEKAV
jgi:hypothetical protein